MSAYPVIVELPAGAAWPDVDGVEVVSVGAHVELALHAVDEKLDALLAQVGEVAHELGGRALDGRSMRELYVEEFERPEPAPAREPEPDPGPIWEHLPGFGAARPFQGGVIDAAPALRNLETGFDVELPDGEDARPSDSALVALLDLPRLLLAHAGPLLVTILVSVAAALSVPDVGMSVSPPVAQLITLAVLTRSSSGPTIRTLGVVLAITVVGSAISLIPIAGILYVVLLVPVFAGATLALDGVDRRSAVAAASYWTSRRIPGLIVALFVVFNATLLVLSPVLLIDTLAFGATAIVTVSVMLVALGVAIGRRIHV